MQRAMLINILNSLFLTIMKFNLNSSFARELTITVLNPISYPLYVTLFLFFP